MQTEIIVFFLFNYISKIKLFLLQTEITVFFLFNYICFKVGCSRQLIRTKTMAKKVVSRM
jgi:hypothetical protein